MYAEAHRQQLLSTARDSILYGLTHHQPLPVRVEDYQEPLRALRATFVTLHDQKGLRGCIGTTQAVAALIVSVADNAFAAAFRDPRFKPLITAEAGAIHISVSILTPATPMTFTGEDDLLAQLQPSVDGLIIEYSGRKATFLPSVWDSLPRPEDFLRQLKLKAGMPLGQTPNRAWRYETEMIE